MHVAVSSLPPSSVLYLSIYLSRFSLSLYVYLYTHTLSLELYIYIFTYTLSLYIYIYIPPTHTYLPSLTSLFHKQTVLSLSLSLSLLVYSCPLFIPLRYSYWLAAASLRY